jgi:hypothetical protein
LIDNFPSVLILFALSAPFKSHSFQSRKEMRDSRRALLTSSLLLRPSAFDRKTYAEKSRASAGAAYELFCLILVGASEEHRAFSLVDTGQPTKKEF